MRPVAVLRRAAATFPARRAVRIVSVLITGLGPTMYDMYAHSRHSTSEEHERQAAAAPCRPRSTAATTAVPYRRRPPAESGGAGHASHEVTTGFG